MTDDPFKRLREINIARQQEKQKLRRQIQEKAETDGFYAIAFALLELAEAQEKPNS